jgi:hypothetical protein
MPLLAQLVAVAFLHGARATRDACDLTNTSAAWATQQVHLPGCEEPFHEEDALLEHSCVSSSDEPVVDQNEIHHAVCACMRRRWWRAARLLLPRVSTSSSVGEVRRFASHARDGASETVTMLLRGSSTGIRHDAVTSVVPAVQWAQAHGAVHVLVRFTTKKHGPVAVANVDDAKVELAANMVSFSARGRGKPLVFELRLPLEQRILPAVSSWSFEGRGQLTLHLVKEVNASWSQLCARAAEGERRGAVTTWHEMLDTITAEEKKNPPPRGDAAAGKGKGDAAAGKGKGDAGKEPVKDEAAAAAPKESASKPQPKARAESPSGGASAKKKQEKKAKGAKRPLPPRPPDGWLASLQWLAALRDRAFQEGATKSWRRLAEWSRGLLGV